MINLLLGVFIGIVIGWLLCCVAIQYSGKMLWKQVEAGRRYETLTSVEALCILSVVPDDIWEEVKRDNLKGVEE